MSLGININIYCMSPFGFTSMYGYCIIMSLGFLHPWIMYMSLYLTFMVNVCQFLHSPLMVTIMASEFVPFLH